MPRRYSTNVAVVWTDWGSLDDCEGYRSPRQMRYIYITQSYFLDMTKEPDVCLCLLCSVNEVDFAIFFKKKSGSCSQSIINLTTYILSQTPTIWSTC